MTTSVDALVAEFTRQLAALTDLPDRFPHYQFRWEPRWDARPVLVATRRPGHTCQPHTLVTPHPDEIRAALDTHTHKPAGHETAR
jgi:hypothetical protein